MIISRMDKHSGWADKMYHRHHWRRGGRINVAEPGEVKDTTTNMLERWHSNPMADADSGGGGGRAQRPGLQRTGGKRFTYIIESQPSANTTPCSSDTTISSGSIDSTKTVSTPDYLMRATSSSFRQSSSRSVFVQNKMKEQQSHFQKLQDMQRHLERATQDATNGVHTEELSETEEMLHVISSLEEINHQNQSNIRHLQQQLKEDETKIHEIEANYHTQLQQLTSQNESMKVKLDGCKKKHFELIEKMASKALEQLHSHDEMTRVEVCDWKHKYEEMGLLYDELVEKFGDMVYENGQLLVKVEQLKTSEAETIGGMQQLQSDNEIMKVQINERREKHETTEKLNDELVEKMSDLAYENGKLLVKCQRLEFKGASLEASTAIEDMESSLKVTHTEKNSRRSLLRSNDSNRVYSARADGQDKSTLLAVIDEMEDENDALHQAIDDAMAVASGTKDLMANFVEAHDASVKSYEEKLANMKDKLKNAALSKEEMAVALYALKDENKALHIERGHYEKELIELKADKQEAYHICDVLQEEIDFLRHRLEEEAEEHNEILHSSNDKGHTQEFESAEHTQTNGIALETIYEVP